MTARTFQSGPTRVLLAEDDDDLRELLLTWLREEGLEVTECTDGLDLLARLQMSVLSGELQEFDLVVSDIQMPLADAFDVLDEFIGCEGVPPALLITAFGGRRADAAARAVGAVGLLEKPFERDRLLAEVRRLSAPRSSGPMR